MSKLSWIFNGIAGLTLIVGVGCASNRPSTPSDVAEVDPKEINKDLTSYLGREVETHGKVAQVIGPNSFVLEGKGDSRLLVVSSVLRDSEMEDAEQAGSVPLPSMKEGDKVKLSGTVDSITVTDVVNVYGVDEAPLAGAFESQDIPAIEVNPASVKVGS